MNTIRRLYFYGLALISIEVVIWGVINLLRTVVSDRLIGAGNLLAMGLSMVLVGLPIFFLHWRTVQRDAAREPEEQASRTRAVFLYAALFITLSPIVYAVLALLNRWIVTLLGEPALQAWFGGEGTAVDNIIAIIVNGVAYSYFWKFLRADWRTAYEWRDDSTLPEKDNENEAKERRGDYWDILSDARRLYIYLWMLAGLTLVVAGVYNLLRYLLGITGDTAGNEALAGGLAMLLIGAPLWWFFWQGVQSSQADPAERHSLLRLVVLYLICLAGVIGVLTAAGGVLNSLIRWILGEANSLVEFLGNNSGSLAALVPLAVMWAYYGKILDQEVAAQPDQPRRDVLRQLYYYVLALLGLAVTFAGLARLASFLSDLALSWNPIPNTWRGELSGSLAALLVGLPLWLLTWPPMQREAARPGSAGDHARRSLLRKSYLYLVLFLLVIGSMAFTAQILFALLNALFGQAANELARDVLELLLWLIIDVTLLVYHWQALRRDSRLAQQTLDNLHSAFPTLILAEEGEGSQFAEATLQTLKRTAPRLPVAVNLVERGAPDETLLAAKAVLMPIHLAIEPPESLRMWLAEYQGQRIVFPQPREGWLWLGMSDKKLQEQAREAAQNLRQLAEGETVRTTVPRSPWAVAGYVLGGLFGLQILAVLFSIMISALFR